MLNLQSHRVSSILRSYQAGPGSTTSLNWLFTRESVDFKSLGLILRSSLRHRPGVTIRVMCGCPRRGKRSFDGASTAALAAGPLSSARVGSSAAPVVVNGSTVASGGGRGGVRWVIWEPKEAQ